VRIPRALARQPRVTDSAALHELLLISGVTTILVIRTQLWLTNYPELGGRGLHIAHLLWGGLFMLVAIGLLLTFLGRSVRRAAAIVGGVGFGFFIDELGKFITQDNNYFFRPAAALIYLIFVGLFLGARAIRRVGADAPLVNAAELLGEAARRPLDVAERREALALLRRSDPANPLVEPLRAVFDGLPARPVAPPGPWERLTGAARAALDRVTAWSRFPTAVAWLFAAWAAASLAGAYARLGDLTFVNAASLGGGVLSALLVGAGLVRLRAGDRASAYRWFDRALLVGIFVTQVFAFVASQFGAVFGLGVDLVLLWMLRAVQASASPAAGDSPDARLAARDRAAYDRAASSTLLTGGQP
jgi:hypothetical protein